MEEPTTRPTPADGAEERAPPVEVEVEYGDDEEEEPPRSATAKQEEASAALGADGSRPFNTRELVGEIKEDAEAADGSGNGGGTGSAFGEGNGTVSADEGSSSRFVRPCAVTLDFLFLPARILSFWKCCYSNISMR
jgi:hypothetical protein